MKNSETYTALLDLESTIANVDGLLSILGYVLEDADDGSAAVVDTGDTDKALTFAAHYQTFSKMLFAAHSSLRDQSEKISAALERAMNACK